VQLIPTFIPVIGQLDDLAVLYLGMKIVRWRTPANILAECETRARAPLRTERAASKLSQDDKPLSDGLNQANLLPGAAD
jgi:uncharacterized membrane protein YkvA (DUF1232 family)